MNALRNGFIAFLVMYPALPVSAQAPPEVPEVEFLEDGTKTYMPEDMFLIELSNYEDRLKLSKITDLRARLFVGNPERLSRAPHERSSGGCFIYRNESFRLSDWGKINGAINLGYFFNYGVRGEYFLKSVPGGFEDQEYTIIFEAPNLAKEFIALDPDNVERYFRRGFTFTVKAPRELSPGPFAHLDERVRRKVEDGQRARVARREIHSQEIGEAVASLKVVVCLKLQDRTDLAWLTPCGDPGRQEERTRIAFIERPRNGRRAIPSMPSIPLFEGSATLR